MIDDDILMDAGTGVGDLTLQEMQGLKHIFLTHSHLDHVCTIPLLIDTLFECLTEPLNIYGRKETIDALKEHVFNWTLWPDFSELPNKKTAVMKYHIMEEGDQVRVSDRTVCMVKVNHAVPGVAYHVTNSESSLCYSGDTTTNDALWQCINSKDTLSLLVIECAFPNENEVLAGLAKHYCPNTLAEDLKKMKGSPQIAITHLKPGGEEATKRQLQALMPDTNFIWLKNGDIINL